MKSQFQKALLILVMLFTGACSFSPSTYIGAMKRAQVDENTVVNDVHFKYTLKGILTNNEQFSLKRIIKKGKANKSNNNIAGDAVGFAMLDGGITTTSVTSGAITSVGVQIGVSMLEKAITPDQTSGILLAKDFTNDKSIDLKVIFDEIKNNSHAAVIKMASHFDYSVECIYKCNTGLSVYELTSLKEPKDENTYLPKKLVVNFLFSKFKPMEADDILFAEKYSFKSNTWEIRIAEARYFNDDGSVKYHFEEHMGGTIFKQPWIGGGNMIETPLGRNMFKFLAKELPFWYFADTDLLQDFAIYQGELYVLEGSKAHDLEGVLVVN